MRLLNLGEYAAIGARAVGIEQSSPYSFIFSFEKMALRDALKSPSGARAFAIGLYDFLHGAAPLQRRFEDWVEVVAALPRRQTRVLTWPVVTVFGFLAQPATHFFMKPKVTRAAALAYSHPLRYQSRPSWEIYAGLLGLARHQAGPARPRTARHDRYSVVSVGARLGRIQRLANCGRDH